MGAKPAKPAGEPAAPAAAVAATAVSKSAFSRVSLSSFGPPSVDRRRIWLARALEVENLDAVRDIFHRPEWFEDLALGDDARKTNDTHAAETRQGDDAEATPAESHQTTSTEERKADEGDDHEEPTSTRDRSASALFHLALNSECIWPQGYTLLHQACAQCSPSFVARLIELGADVNARSTGSLDTGVSFLRDRLLVFYRSALDPKDAPYAHLYHDRLDNGNLMSEVKYRETGLTPMMVAIIFARDDRLVDLVQLLLLSDADLTSRTRGIEWTLAHFAAMRTATEVGRRCWSMLLESSMASQLDVEDQLGATPEVAAARFGRRDSVKNIRAEADRRRGVRQEMNATLGERFRMAQVCVDMCVEYAGL